MGRMIYSWTLVASALCFSAAGCGGLGADGASGVSAGLRATDGGAGCHCGARGHDDDDDASVDETGNHCPHGGRGDHEPGNDGQGDHDRGTGDHDRR